MSTNEQELKGALSHIYINSRSLTVQRKCKAALVKIRSAQTLIKQAKATLLWAESYKPEDHETYVNSIKE